MQGVRFTVPPKIWKDRETGLRGGDIAIDKCMPMLLMVWRPILLISLQIVDFTINRFL